MGDSFIAGGPDPDTGLSRFLRRYWLPLMLTGIFLGLIVLAAVISPGQVQTTSQRTDVPHVTVEPLASPCIACKLGNACNPKTGRCELIERTPVPCVDGSVYDESEQFCRPAATPRPTTPPTRTLRPGSTPRPATSATPPSTQATPRPTTSGSTPAPEATP